MSRKIDEKLDSGEEIKANLDNPGTIIGIISLKGGVGKTSSVANLGAALTSKFSKKVLVVDANFTAPNLGLHLGLSNPDTTIHDVLLNQADAEDAIYRHHSGIHIMPGAFISRKINPFKLKQKINHLRHYYDIILIDSSPNLNEEIMSTMVASDSLYVVTSPDFPTLSTTLKAVRLARQKRTPISGLILNRVRGKKFELSIKDIEDAAQVPVVSVLPEDIRVAESIAYTSPVSLHKPKSKASIEYNKLAAAMINEPYQDPRMWSRLKGLFTKEIPKDNINRLLMKK
jgi:septum site-determining protein MinD